MDRFNIFKDDTSFYDCRSQAPNRICNDSNSNRLLQIHSLFSHAKASYPKDASAVAIYYI